MAAFIAATSLVNFPRPATITVIRRAKSAACAVLKVRCPAIHSADHSLRKFPAAALATGAGDTSAAGDAFGVAIAVGIALRARPAVSMAPVATA